jgi:hypothetical protein
VAGDITDPAVTDRVIGDWKCALKMYSSKSSAVGAKVAGRSF